MEHRMMETEAPRKEESENKDKSAELQRDIEVLPNGLKMTENIIKKRNNEVQAELLRKVLNRNALKKFLQNLFLQFTTLSQILLPQKWL